MKTQKSFSPSLLFDPVLLSGGTVNEQTGEEEHYGNDDDEVTSDEG